MHIEKKKACSGVFWGVVVWGGWWKIAVFLHLKFWDVWIFRSMLMNCLFFLKYLYKQLDCR